jgi:hypothetical protein
LRAVDLAASRAGSKVLRDDIPEDASTIDQLFAPLPVADGKGTVWTWRSESKEFVSVPVRIGVTDGQMTALIEGDIQPGDELVTGVILPQVAQSGPRNPFVGNQPRGGGMQPGPGQNNNQQQQQQPTRGFQERGNQSGGGRGGG